MNTRYCGWSRVVRERAVPPDDDHVRVIKIRSHRGCDARTCGTSWNEIPRWWLGEIFIKWAGGRYECAVLGIPDVDGNGVQYGKA